MLDEQLRRKTMKSLWQKLARLPAPLAVKWRARGWRSLRIAATM